MEQNKVLIFSKQCINKNAFYKNTIDIIDITIDIIDIRRIVLSKKDLYGAKRFI